MSVPLVYRLLRLAPNFPKFFYGPRDAPQQFCFVLLSKLCPPHTLRLAWIYLSWFRGDIFPTEELLVAHPTCYGQHSWLNNSLDPGYLMPSANSLLLNCQQYILSQLIHHVISGASYHIPCTKLKKYLPLFLLKVFRQLVKSSIHLCLSSFRSSYSLCMLPVS